MNGQFISKQASKQARVEYIDLLRGFGIILMIMGHVGFGSIFDKWIHSFHMPMFFIVSGYFYKARSFGDLLKRRAKTLLIPYIAFGIICCIIPTALMKSLDENTFRILFFENTDGIPIAGALWFLTAMFFTDIIYSILDKIFKNGVLTIAVMVLAIFGMISASYLPIRLPWALDASMVGVGLFHVGRLMKNRRVLNLSAMVSVMVFIAITILVIANHPVNMRTGNYGIWPIFWVGAIGMTIALWNICKVIESGKGLRHFKKWLSGIGSDSITYLCLNQITILVVSHICNIIGLGNLSGVRLGVERLGILFISLLLLYFENIVISKTRLRVLIGKW